MPAIRFRCFYLHNRAQPYRGQATLPQGSTEPVGPGGRGFSVETAEGCESVAAFAAFGSSYLNSRSANHPAYRDPVLLLILLLIWLLILRAPSNHAGRNSTLRRGANRQGCRFSRPRPWMAVGGGATPQCRITGMPSTSEGPSGGAQTFWLLLGRLPKVTRRKGGTVSSHHRSNGYVHK